MATNCSQYCQLNLNGRITNVNSVFVLHFLCCYKESRIYLIPLYCCLLATRGAGKEWNRPTGTGIHINQTEMQSLVFQHKSHLNAMTLKCCTIKPAKIFLKVVVDFFSNKYSYISFRVLTVAGQLHLSFSRIEIILTASQL